MEFMQFFTQSSSARYVKINARPEYLSALNIADLHFRERTDRSFVNSRSESAALGLPRTTLYECCCGVRCPFA